MTLSLHIAAGNTEYIDIYRPKVVQGPRSIPKIGLLTHHQFFGTNIFKIKYFFRHIDFLIKILFPNFFDTKLIQPKKISTKAFFSKFFVDQEIFVDHNYC